MEKRASETCGTKWLYMCVMTDPGESRQQVGKLFKEIMFRS